MAALLLLLPAPGPPGIAGHRAAEPGGGAVRAESDSEIPAQERIRYYSARIAETPRLYPMHTQLGIAFLDRAKETHDPRWLEEARASELRALAIQDNFESLMAMAAIQNYAHRFEEAKRWAGLAAAASVNGPASPDPAATAALVEALLGLGEIDPARRLLPSSLEETKDFHTAASLGKCAAEEGRAGDAAAAFERAARFARAESVPALAAWAEAAAAGALIDAGRATEARPHLETAIAIAPGEPVVLLHRAELLQAVGRHAEALGILEGFLVSNPDPAVEALAFKAAKEAGESTTAKRHFAAAERGLKRAVEAGEVYSLGALARLYLDSGRRSEKALSLAEENLRWKRDRDARAIAEAARAAARRQAGGP